MRVLLVANRSPWPPTNGASIRQYFILKALKERGHHVEVFSFAEPEIADESEQRTLAMADGGRIVPIDPIRTKLGALRALVTGAPLTVGYYSSVELCREIARSHAVCPFDTAIVHSGNVAQYVPTSLRARSLFDMADVDSAKFADYAKDGAWPMRLVNALEARRLHRYEFEAIKDFAATCLVAERERDLILDELQQKGLQDKVFVVSNGVDTDYFQPGAHQPLDVGNLPARERQFFLAGGPRIVFTGVMNYPPNIEAAARFAQSILPRVRAAVPDAEFYVVGSRPTAEVLALARLPGVRVTGFVDDARPYFTSAEVYVLPLRVARGVQNKALEAMASGCAIVSTSNVAEGLRAGPARTTRGQHLLIADDDEQFAAAVVSLLADRRRAKELGAEARRFVEANFGWGPLMAQLIERLADVAREGATVVRSPLLTTGLQ